jgi:gas vesicle protein
MKAINFIGYGVSFFLGLVLGAAVAVVLTPESGPEMRARIGEKAGAVGQQLRSGYERSRQWVESEAAKLQTKQSPAKTTEVASIE